MSLLAKKTGLIILSALLIFSCKEKENVGLELQTEDNKIGTIFTDTVSIITKAVLKNDSIVTNSNYVYVGAVGDNLFGNVNAESYTQLALNNPIPTSVADGFIVDTVELTMVYDDYYGDTTQSQTINVYKLTVPLPANTPFFSTSNKHLYESAINKQDKDSSWAARPLRDNNTIKLQLKTSFGNDIINLIKAGFNTNATFMAEFHGIAIVPKEDDKGAVFRVKLDNSSKITIKYREGTTKKTLELLMNTGGLRYSRIISDRTGTGIVDLEDSGDTAVTSGIYLQSGIGVRSKIQFPYLSKLKNQGNIAINRAELVLTIDPATANPLIPVTVLHLLKLNSLGKVKQYYDGTSYYDDVVQVDQSDVNGHLNPLNVFYNSTTKTYTFNVSTYINAVLQGVEENNGLIIAPHPIVNNVSIRRTFIDPSKIKLNVYYTKINQ